MNIPKFLMAMLMFTFIGLFTPTLFDVIFSADMSLWTFTGHTVAAIFITLFPYLFAVACLFLGLSFMKGAIEE